MRGAGAALIACLLAGFTPSARAELPMTFSLAPLADVELAREHGKFLLPNGIEIALSISSRTMVDGRPVLQTELAVKGDGSSLTIFSAPTTSAGGGDGGSDVNAASNGQVTTSSSDRGTIIRYQGEGLVIQQMAGGLSGSMLQNTADNRVIDMSTTVALQVSNVDISSIGSFNANMERIAVGSAQVSAR